MFNNILFFDASSISFYERTKRPIKVGPIEEKLLKNTKSLKPEVTKIKTEEKEENL